MAWGRACGGREAKEPVEGAKKKNVMIRTISENKGDVIVSAGWELF